MSNCPEGRRQNIAPSLGISWSNWVTVRLMMRRTQHTISVQSYTESDGANISACVRDIEVHFAPHIANGSCKFVIDEEGVKGLQQK